MVLLGDERVKLSEAVESGSSVLNALNRDGLTLMNVINFELFSSDNAIDIERQCVEIELTFVRVRMLELKHKYVLLKYSLKLSS